jgi:hypothetical protein
VISLLAAAVTIILDLALAFLVSYWIVLLWEKLKR